MGKHRKATFHASSCSRNSINKHPEQSKCLWFNLSPDCSINHSTEATWIQRHVEVLKLDFHSNCFWISKTCGLVCIVIAMWFCVICLEASQSEGDAARQCFCCIRRFDLRGKRRCLLCHHAPFSSPSVCDVSKQLFEMFFLLWPETKEIYIHDEIVLLLKLLKCCLLFET